MRDKELQHAIALEEEIHAAAKGSSSLEEARAAIAAVVLPRVERGVSDDVEVDGFSGGGVSGEWVETPFDAGGRVILLVDVRAWLIGSAAQSREFAARLARVAHAPVVTLDHRLPREDPYPAGRDDVVAALRHMVAEGIDPRKIGVVGVSTGAALALSAVLALRDAGEPGPGALALVSPVVDLTSVEPGADDPLGAWEPIARHIPDYLGATPASDPGASPALADLAGLPPLLVQYGGADPASAQAEAFAVRAEAAGVEVTRGVWDTAIHAWPKFAHIREGYVATSQIGDWLLQRTGPAYVPVPFD
ncbi:unannotated protein [freshwater metagenome]|uniref:Unannotated protein n=1 Tax=freshwater metagenome TaxID=449393 RepID=A0A6J7IGF5_9ZZZZ|nr:alpha/beta hydrolase fold domain-containing protein [Actinomycetota bacterium]